LTFFIFCYKFIFNLSSNISEYLYKDSVERRIEMDRRCFLKLGLSMIVSQILPAYALGSQLLPIENERRICIYNMHTKEYINVVYYRDGNYLEDAFRQINHIFRDHYTGRIREIDRRLIDFLYAIHRKLNANEPFYLISGYRTKWTNEMLRKRYHGLVAKRSLHIFGKAADIRLPEHRLRQIRRVAYELKMGGVGYYPAKNFIHVDVGSVRFWRG